MPCVLYIYDIILICLHIIHVHSSLSEMCGYYSLCVYTGRGIMIYCCSILLLHKVYKDANNKISEMPSLEYTSHSVKRRIYLYFFLKKIKKIIISDTAVLSLLCVYTEYCGAIGSIAPNNREPP